MIYGTIAFQNLSIKTRLSWRRNLLLLLQGSLLQAACQRMAGLCGLAGVLQAGLEQLSQTSLDGKGLQALEPSLGKVLPATPSAAKFGDIVRAKKLGGISTAFDSDRCSAGGYCPG